MKKNVKCWTADRRTGTFIDRFYSIEEAKSAIREYEESDKKDGDYEENFYDIVNDSHYSLIN